MNRKLLVAVLAGVSMALMADEEPFEAEEVWNCGGDIRLVGGDDQIVPNASVTIFGREVPALFSLEGLDLTWRFGDDFFEQQFPGFDVEAYSEKHGQSSMFGYYQIVIRSGSNLITSDFAGLYYDFTDVEEGESVEPSQILFCERE